jgi:8-oxo-dGTP diphosphatase
MTDSIHAVGVIFENPEGKILLLLRHKQDPEGQTWGLVGGKIETGENKEQTAVREVKEEIGHNLDTSKLIFLKTYNWDRKDINLIFEVFKIKITEDEIDPQLDKNESTQYLWIDPRNAHERNDLMIGLYPILEDFYHTR